ncbi:BirA family transcriptional regulator, biotin operon repressor / biotin-[acetyl-CoA-carboxylase] ligase [Collimonas sp. OK242]|jgi:BirA family biotin operon repressor/biotin-[acetyl-CoA-carboxylase] ligase|nr:BirA family transcriptional regulator, biotin operon repressor / biotin-[acetyl-CoA-carboxylase] ligase [Collimonas sp. OK242]
MRGMTAQFIAPIPLASHLSAARITAFAGHRAEQCRIEVVAETGSTNADLLARIAGGVHSRTLNALTAPTLLVAQTQTAGRGRAGRTWLTAPSAALTFSLAWPFAAPLQALVGLPLAVGATIAEILADFGVEVQLKWPNDVLHKGRKLAGILIETATAPDRQLWAVIGIGINLAMPQQLQEQIGRPAANLPLPAAQDRELLLGSLLSGLAQNMRQFESEGLAAFVERWNRLHAFAGQQVLILDQGKTLHEGRALGIDQIGRLLLQTDAGDSPLAIMAGDISLRPKEG